MHAIYLKFHTQAAAEVLQRAVMMRQRPDLNFRCWNSQRSFWRAPDARPGGIPGFPQNCRDQLAEPALIPSSGCLWNRWALVESARRSRTHLVWLQICEQLHAFDSLARKTCLLWSAQFDMGLFFLGTTKTGREGGYQT